MKHAGLLSCPYFSNGNAHTLCDVLNPGCNGLPLSVCDPCADRIAKPLQYVLRTDRHRGHLVCQFVWCALRASSNMLTKNLLETYSSNTVERITFKSFVPTTHIISIYQGLTSSIVLQYSTNIFVQP